MTVFFPLIASEGGFGINLNLFETNLINLVIVIQGLQFFWLSSQTSMENSLMNLGAIQKLFERFAVTLPS